MPPAADSNRVRDAAYLIVNADDLGMAAAVNRAIFRAHREGIVTSASLMAPGAAFDAAVAALREHPELGVGVHLCLCDERPVLPLEEIPTLVGEHGRFPGLGTVVRRLLLGRMRGDEIESELRAQVLRVRAAGVAVDHLDSHCHLHAFPSVGRAVARVARDLGIRCARRVEVTPGVDFAGSAPVRRMVGIGITAASRATRALSRSGLRHPDRFLGLVRSGAVDAAWICEAVRSLAPGSVSELMLHPGDGSPIPGLGDDHGAEVRRVELEAALDPRVRETLRACNVRLVSYRHLAAA